MCNVISRKKILATDEAKWSRLNLKSIQTFENKNPPKMGLERILGWTILYLAFYIANCQGKPNDIFFLFKLSSRALVQVVLLCKCTLQQIRQKRSHNFGANF